MIRKLLMVMLAFSLLVPTAFVMADESMKTDIVKNDKFSVEIPKELNGSYFAEIKKDRIMFYDKASKNSGFGGFAFGIILYKKPSEHATMPGARKIGEFKSKFGRLYDVVLAQPTDVQYDYTKKISEEYKMLYELGNNVEISGINGSKYVKGGGIKGQDLYGKVLKNLIRKIKTSRSASDLEKSNLSYMYYQISQDKSVDMLDRIGYKFADINGDGTDELLIGEIAQGEWKGIVYDIYTMVNRKPKHVVSGGSRNRYYVCDDVFVCNEYSSGADESGMRVYILVENSTELYPQVAFKYDAYANAQNPWFWSYGKFENDDDWENVKEEDFTERKKTFEKYERYDYIPLSKFSDKN